MTSRSQAIVQTRKREVGALRAKLKLKWLVVLVGVNKTMGEIPNEIEIHIHCHLPTSREYLTKLIMTMGMAAAGFAPDFYNDTRFTQS